jgi:hypothetical protein
MAVERTSVRIVSTHNVEEPWLFGSSSLASTIVNYYSIEVKCGSAAWSVERRYRNFAELGALLAQAYGRAELPKLPPKLFSHSPEAIATRCTELEVFLRRCSQHPPIGLSRYWYHFLTDEWQLVRMVRPRVVLTCDAVHADQATPLDMVLPQIEEAPAEVAEVEVELAKAAEAAEAETAETAAEEEVAEAMAHPRASLVPLAFRQGPKADDRPQGANDGNTSSAWSDDNSSAPEDGEAAAKAAVTSLADVSADSTAGELQQANAAAEASEEVVEPACHVEPACLFAAVLSSYEEVLHHLSETLVHAATGPAPNPARKPKAFEDLFEDFPATTGARVEERPARSPERLPEMSERSTEMDQVVPVRRRPLSLVQMVAAGTASVAVAAAERAQQKIHSFPALSPLQQRLQQREAARALECSRNFPTPSRLARFAALQPVAERRSHSTPDGVSGSHPIHTQSRSTTDGGAQTTAQTSGAAAAATSHHGLSRLGDGVNARLHSHLGDCEIARLHSHLGDGEIARLPSHLGDGVNARLHSHLGNGEIARLHSHLGDGENARLHSHLGEGVNARLDEDECMDECMDEYMDELSAPQRQQLWLAKLVKAYEAADLHVEDNEDDEDDEDKEEVKSEDRRVRISASRTKRLTRRRRSSFSRVHQWLRVTRRPVQVQL